MKDVAMLAHSSLDKLLMFSLALFSPNQTDVGRFQTLVGRGAHFATALRPNSSSFPPFLSFSIGSFQKKNVSFRNRRRRRDAVRIFFCSSTLRSKKKRTRTNSAKVKRRTSHAPHRRPTTNGARTVPRPLPPATPPPRPDRLRPADTVPP